MNTEKRVCSMVLTIGALFLMSAGVASALEYKGFDIHGYVSGGFLYSDHNNYMTVDTEDGSFRFYDVGVNVGRDLVPNVRAAGQVAVRRVGRTGGDRPTVDWAHLDYRPLDEFGVRAGILVYPVGLFNAERDMDMLRPTVFLPQGVYNEQLRPLFSGQPGGQVYGNVRIGKAGSLGYNLTVGTISFNERKFTWGNQIASEVVDGVRRGLPGPPPPGFMQKTDYDFNNNYALAAALIWETPIHGLRFGGSYTRTDTDVTIRTTAPGGPFAPLQSFDLSFLQKGYVILSADYVWNRWRFTSEYMTSRFEFDFDTLPIATQQRNSAGYYFQAAYRFNEWMEMSTYYSIYYPDIEDKKGGNHTAVGRPNYLAWQKDFCVATRFDINQNLQLKFEWHLIDGAGQLYYTDNPNGFKRNWNLFAVKAIYTF